MSLFAIVTYSVLGIAFILRIRDNLRLRELRAKGLLPVRRRRRARARANEEPLNYGSESYGPMGNRGISGFPGDLL